MSDLRTLAQPLLDRPPVAPRSVADIRRDSRRRQRKHRVLAFAMVVAIGALGSAVLASGVRNGRAPVVHTTDRPARGAPTYVSQLEVGEASGIAVGPNAVWVLGDDVVRKVDPKLNAVVDTVAVSGSGGDRHIIAALGAVWVSDQQAGLVTRIDPKTSRVAATVHVDDPTSMAAAGGRIWVAQALLSHGCHGPSLASCVTISTGVPLVPIDPKDNRVGTPIALQGAPTAALVDGGGSTLFVDDFVSVLRVDTASGAVRTAPAFDPPDTAVIALAKSGAALYALTSTARVLEVDPSSLVVQRISGAIPGATRLAVGAGSVWVLSQSANSMSELHRLRPGSLEPVGDAIDSGSFPGQLAVGAHTIWVTHPTQGGFNDQGTVTRVDEQKLTDRPELCPGSVAMRSLSLTADGLPPLTSAITNRNQAMSDLRGRKKALLREHPHAVSVSLGRGYGRAWTRDSKGHVVIVAVKDYALIVHLDERRDCPSGRVLNNTSAGLPVFFAVPR